MKKKKQTNPKKMNRGETNFNRNVKDGAQTTGKHARTDGESSRIPSPAAGKPYFEVLDSVRNNSCDQDGYKLTDAQKRLLEVQGVAIDLLLRAHNSMIELAAVRLECKLSNTRVSGVAKELKELIKVMSVYDC